MNVVLLSHPFLNHNIMLIMDDSKGTVIDTETGFQASFHDDLGEDEIEEIAKNWLRWQTYIDVSPAEVNSNKYSGIYWWNRKSEATKNERIGEIENMIMEVY